MLPHRIYALVSVVGFCAFRQQACGLSDQDLSALLRMETHPSQCRRLAWHKIAAQSEGMCRIMLLCTTAVSSSEHHLLVLADTEVWVCNDM